MGRSLPFLQGRCPHSGKETVFPPRGTLSTISSDQGTHFTEQVIWAVTEALQTSWNYCRPHCPQSSGKGRENLHKTLIQVRQVLVTWDGINL